MSVARSTYLRTAVGKYERLRHDFVDCMGIYVVPHGVMNDRDISDTIFELFHYCCAASQPRVYNYIVTITINVIACNRQSYVMLYRSMVYLRKFHLIRSII
jgi:hypothetical protein